MLYRYNGHGDVVQLANAAGMVTKEYDYDAFGNEKDPGTSDTNPFRYCGEYYDISSGTYYLRARYYDPTTGRFSGEDTYRGQATDPLSLNLYTYCSNNPIKYTDPMGHWQKGDRNLANWAKSLIVTATRQYNIAKANNDTAGMAQPHEHAEAIRQFMEKQRLNGIILRNLSLIHLTMIQVHRGEADKIIMLIFKKKSFTIKASSTDIIDALKTLPPTSTFFNTFSERSFSFCVYEKHERMHGPIRFWGTIEEQGEKRTIKYTIIPGIAILFVLSVFLLAFLYAFVLLLFSNVSWIPLVISALSTLFICLITLGQEQSCNERLIRKLHELENKEK